MPAPERPLILLYNPAAPYYTLPLQFLALASVIDRKRYEVAIIDARIERSTQHAHQKLISLLPRALCVGISVITGTPVRDAVDITRRIKALAPGVPVVWGGWHPSIYPEQCLREGKADFCVTGQGELTFAELVDTLSEGTHAGDVEGLAYCEVGEFIRTPDRKFTDINTFPRYDYGLLPMEEYFRLKKLRQLDFYSSQGCPYRCGFCADPYVYNRRWSGLRAGRMIADVADAVGRYAIEDVIFQDENFFANKARVEEFCRGVRKSGLRFSWTATSRADQIAPLDDAFLREMAAANLRKVVIGAESGSQEMLDLMKKDTLAEEAIISAEKLARHGIGASFNFIVGFPEEPFTETLKTLGAIKRIKRIDPSMEFNVFFFTPYPGTELFSYIVQKGFRVPQNLAEWSDIDFIMYSGYWVKEHEREYVDRFKFYTKLATEGKSGRRWTRPLNYLAERRTARDFYSFPVEKGIVNFVRHALLHRTNW